MKRLEGLRFADFTLQGIHGGPTIDLSINVGLGGFLGVALARRVIQQPILRDNSSGITIS